MQPITRATINAFCRVCLQEFNASSKKNEYQLPPGRSGIFENTDENLDKLMRFIAADDDDDFARQQSGLLPRRLCGACRVKACTFFEFHEKARCTASVLDETLQEELRESMIRNLQKFCRTCLKQIKVSNTDILSHVDDVEVHTWLQECIDFNVVEDNDKLDEYPKQLCNWCSRKLRNFIEFRRLSKESLDYLDSLFGGMDDDTEKKAVAIIDTEIEQTTPDDFKANAPDAASLMEDSTAPPNKENDCDIFAEQLPVFKATSTKRKFNAQTDDRHNFEQDSDFNWDNEDDDDDDTDTDSNNDEHNVDEDNSETSNDKTNNDFAGVIDKHIVAPDTDEEDYEDDDLPIKVMAERLLARKKEAKQNTSRDKVKEFIAINGIDTKTEQQEIKCEIEEPFCNSSSADEFTPTKTTTKHRKRKSSEELLKKTKKPKSTDPDKKPKVSSTKKSLNCPKCQKRFYKQILYEAHIRSEHEGVEQPFQCEHCPKTYRAYPFLQQHIRNEHSDKLPNLKCQFCSRLFKRKDHLRNHIRGVHEGIRPYKCSYCEKTFGARKTVRVHEMTHTDERPFQCKLCPQAYRQATDLRVHMERHTTSPELLCPICKRAKGSAEELQAHIAEHDKTRHQCPTCGRVFKKRSHLRDHENAVHLGLRPHKCGYCDHSFACRKSMLDHQRLHTNERPKVCQFCQLTFRQGSVLRAHIRRRHECVGEPVKARKSKASRLAPAPQPQSEPSENLNDLLLFKSTLN